MAHAAPFKTKDWPPVRNLIADHLNIARRTNLIHSLLEVDITTLRPALKRAGRDVTLSTYLMHALAQCLKEHPDILAMRWGRKKLVVFDDVNMLVIVERKSPQGPVPVAIVLRGAQRKSLEEITAEITRAKTANPLEFEEVRLRRKLLSYPGWIRRLVLRWIDASPLRHDKYYGNVALTSLVSQSGHRAWWGIPLSRAPLCLTPGSVYHKAVFINGKLEDRLMLGLCISMNHDTIDGAPAKRFITELVKRIERHEDL